MKKVQLVLGISLLLLAACKKPNVETPSPIEPGSPIKNARALGLIPADKQTYPQFINWQKLAANAKPASCPASVDLTADFPAPGNQGVQESSVAWAVGYYIKSYYEGNENNWALTTSNHLTSPQYIYSQTHATNNSGGGNSTFANALNLLTSQGAATLDVSPYNPADPFGFLSTPTDAMRMQAFRFRNTGWSALPYRDVDAIKNQLCNNVPVALGVPVYPDLDNLDASNDTYDNFSGTSRGFHGIALTGYDDTRQAFSFINSWDVSWGLNGYGWISYNLIANNDLEAYVMFDDVNPPIAEAWNSTSLYGLGTLGYYSGDVNGDGNTDVIHPWNNNGTLAVLAHDITGSPTTALINQTLSGIGASTVGYAAADVNGDGKTDLVQGWANGTKLALSVFTSNGNSLSHTWTGTTTNGYQNLRLLPVDYDGDGKTDIAQLWANGSQLGIITYRSNGTSYSMAASVTIPITHSHLAFFPADYDNDGKTDIIQTANSTSTNSLFVAVHRSTGTNYTNAWSGFMGQGPGNVGFAPVEFDGDGKIDFVQGWSNGGKLNYLVYKSTGSSYVYHSNIATRQGSNHLSLLPQKRAGSSRSGVTQLWNNNTKLAFIRYDDITY